jgi:type II secretory ATPase GspE/PulE/Tfp pilus assembly ATPase PilB-like protein
MTRILCSPTSEATVRAATLAAPTAAGSNGGDGILFPAGEPGLDELVAQHPEQIVTGMLARAMQMQASDVYLLSDEEGLTIAVRQWGMVRTLRTIPAEKGRQLLVHVKAMAGMDIVNTRRPADGRWIQTVAGKKVDLRLSSVPTLYGEDLTIRLLSRDAQSLTLENLGMTQRNVHDVQAILNNPSGLLLVCGPTGTGKTTTMYSCLARLHNGKRKINTIEEPIEYSLPGVRQSQVNPKIGVEYADLLKSILRQAPDVIMVGEIRDAETAITAVRAANSGHLVLATLHAPVSAGAVQSLLALGVHPHFLATSLLGVLAQRLVRKLCPACKKPFELEGAPTFHDIRSLLGPGEGQSMYGPGGCDVCHHDGYYGRTGVFEIMTFDRDLRRLVAESRPARELEQRAIEDGMIHFRRAAMLKVAQGVTSMEEVLRSVPVEYLGLDD